MSEIRRDDVERTRVEISTGIPYGDFVAAFERAAPPMDPAPLRSIAESGGTWADVEAATAVNAPNELMVYARIDATEIMSVAGHRVQAMEYLLGNHVIAETMFRHDPRAMLYAPLRVLVHSDADGAAVFVIERPSSVFASLGIPEVTKVGHDLDSKVANLLAVIGVDPGDAFVD